MTYDASPGGVVFVHETGEAVPVDQDRFDLISRYPHFHETVEDCAACAKCMDRAAVLRLLDELRAATPEERAELLAELTPAAVEELRREEGGGDAIEEP